MASNSEDRDWRLDKSVEPFKMIKTNPTQPYPTVLETPKPIDQERLKKIQKVPVPNSTQDFWNSIYSGGYGTNDPNLLYPINIKEVLGKIFSSLQFYTMS